MARFDPDPPFGSVLRRLRQEQGLTIEEAAKRAGVTANYLGDVERGQRNPTMKVVSRLLAGLRVNWTQLAQRLDET
jgi:transcriptional regulator with XRE-family HTH domain